jgi:hypothetical protein
VRAACAREVQAQPGGPITTQKGYTLESRTADEVGGGGSRAVIRDQIRLKLAFIHSPCSIYASARGVMGGFLWRGRGLKAGPCCAGKVAQEKVRYCQEFTAERHSIPDPHGTIRGHVGVAHVSCPLRAQTTRRQGGESTTVANSTFRVNWTLQYTVQYCGGPYKCATDRLLRRPGPATCLSNLSLKIICRCVAYVSA